MKILRDPISLNDVLSTIGGGLPLRLKYAQLQEASAAQNVSILGPISS